MSVAGTVTPIEQAASAPDLSVIEVAIAVVCTRTPNAAFDEISAEVGRWFGKELKPQQIERPLQRLVTRGDVVSDGLRFAATPLGSSRAESAARSLVHLLFRERYYFDVGKLLDLALEKEEHLRAN